MSANDYDIDVNVATRFLAEEPYGTNRAFLHRIAPK